MTRPTVASLVADGRLPAPARPDLTWSYSRATGWTWDGAPTVTVVHDPPPLLAGLLRQELGELVAIPCPTCEDGTAYPHSTSPRKTTCRDCSGAKTVQVPATEVGP